MGQTRTSIVHQTRLAPSPTGALHLGNARTFLINWARARQAGWSVLLRIEDLDTPRVKPGAIEETIDTLRWLGIDWDRGPVIQSDDLEPYRDAMQHLAEQGFAYPCELTRSQIEAAASAPHEGSHELAFPASLRPAVVPAAFDRPDANWRLVVSQGAVRFDDVFRGPTTVDVAREVGDFVIWTKRGQPSYQLAVVVDDHRQGVTQVIRGDDLVGSAGRQLLLYRALGLQPEPMYTHLPLVRGADGRRLAKRHGDTKLTSYRDSGIAPERIVGLIAYWSGLCAQRREMSATEFRDTFALDRMPERDVVFSQEDEQWLRDRS